MNTMTLQNWQAFGRDAILSNFLSILAGIHADMDRLINNLNKMAKKFVLQNNVTNGNGSYLAYGDFIETSNNTLLTPSFYVTMHEEDYDTLADAKAAVIAGILAEASSRAYSGFSASDIQDMSTPAALANAPQASIADAPADATTNYNVITTLLGGLTGAVNTANTKQNDIATVVNSILATLRTVGIIS